MSDAAMHMYDVAIDALPDAHDPEFADRAGVILAGLRKLIGSLTDAAGRSRATPSVVVALSAVRRRYDDLMEAAANGVGLRSDLIEAVEVEEPATEEETSRIKDLIAALGG